MLTIVSAAVLRFPPSPESNVVVYSKESLITGRLWEATLNWGKEFSFRKGIVLEIVLLLRKVDIMGKTFSNTFVRDYSAVGRGFQVVGQQSIWQADRSLGKAGDPEVHKERECLERVALGVVSRFEGDW